jgi:hypothetical protein
MHLHRIAPDPNVESREAAEAIQRASNAQRAADVRRKLATHVTLLDDDASFESLALLGDAHDREKSHPRAADEEAFEKADDAVDGDADPHRSYWA